MPEYKCSMCFFASNNFEKYKNHIVRIHKNDANFIVHCNIENCNFTARKWSTFKSHVSRKHRDIPGSGEEENIEDYDDVDEVNFNSLERETHLEAKYALALQAQHGLSISAVNAVLDSTSDILDGKMTVFKDIIRERLNENGVETSFLDDIMEPNLFSALKTNNARIKYYADNLSLIKPVEVVLEHKIVTIRGRHSIKNELGYCIPFEKSLTRFLEMPEVWHYINNPVGNSGQDMMEDIQDGNYIHSHPLFSRNPKALKIIMNCDDIEIVNPIGKNVKKHKLCMFYYTLGNVPAKHRSRLTAIQLLAVAKTKHIKQCGPLALLSDFIDVVNRLNNGGIQCNINGSMERVEGTLVMAPNDTLASQWLGGFKEGVGFSYKGCRTCDSSRLDMKTKFIEKQHNLRDEATHKERCDTLEENLSSKTRAYWSRIWGINSRSPLCNISDFRITDCLVHDPMHDLLEGVIPYELKLLLQHLIFIEKCFTLEWFNRQILSFKYTYLDVRTKPEIIDLKHLKGKGKLQQSAMSMFTLCMILPFVLASKLPDDHNKWTNFLKLLQITLLVTSPTADSTTAGQLEQLIFEHNTVFVQEYPDSSVIPKMHYLIHFPRQILMFGPGRFHWCLRFEAKHSFFKGKKWKNFKNLPYSIAMTHQVYMCHKMANPANFLYEGDLIKEGIAICLSDLYPNLGQESSDLQDRYGTDVVYRTTNMTIHGHEYRTGACLRTGYSDSNGPKFAVIKDMFCKEGIKFFILQDAIIEYFDYKTVAYIVELTNHLVCKAHHELLCKWPLSMYRMGCGKLAVIDRYSHRCEFLS